MLFRACFYLTHVRSVMRRKPQENIYIILRNHQLYSISMTFSFLLLVAYGVSFCGSSSVIPIRYRQCLCHCSFTSFRANPRPSSRLRLSLNTLLIAVPFDSRVWITLLPTWTPREDKETTRITNPNPRLRDRFHFHRDRPRLTAKAWR